jgi:hypothetical protein
MARPDLLHPGEQLRMPTGGDPATGTATATAARPAKVTTSRPAAARSRSGEGSGEGSGRGSGGDAGEGHGAGSAAETVRGAAGRATGSAAKATGSAARATRSAAKAAGGTGGSGRKMKIWLTGYSYQDNTPAGSAEVSQPILHQDAGGTGTYADPITVAVPGKGSGIWKAGSKFYLPTVKRYVIAEDTGASPAPSGQDGHLDMWIGGKGGTKSATDSCMDKITGTGVPATFNPPANLPVISGPVWNQSCRVPG